MQNSGSLLCIPRIIIMHTLCPFQDVKQWFKFRCCTNKHHIYTVSIVKCETMVPLYVSRPKSSHLHCVCFRMWNNGPFLSLTNITNALKLCLFRNVKQWFILICHARNHNTYTVTVSECETSVYTYVSDTYSSHTYCVCFRTWKNVTHILIISTLWLFLNVKQWFIHVCHTHTHHTYIVSDLKHDKMVHWYMSLHILIISTLCLFQNVKQWIIRMYQAHYHHTYTVSLSECETMVHHTNMTSL